MLLQNLNEGNNDRTKFQENMLSTSTCLRFQQVHLILIGCKTVMQIGMSTRELFKVGM